MPSVAIADFSGGFLTSDPFIVSPLESTTLTFEVREDGSLVSGQAVTFSVSPDDGIASLSTTSATTDSNGQAQTTLSLSGDSPERHYFLTAELDNVKDKKALISVPVRAMSDGAELILQRVFKYGEGSRQIQAR